MIPPMNRRSMRSAVFFFSCWKKKEASETRNSAVSKSVSAPATSLPARPVRGGRRSRKVLSVSWPLPSLSPSCGTTKLEAWIAGDTWRPRSSLVLPPAWGPIVSRGVRCPAPPARLLLFLPSPSINILDDGSPSRGGHTAGARRAKENATRTTHGTRQVAHRF